MQKNQKQSTNQAQEPVRLAASREYRCYSVKMNQYLKENGLTMLREERHPTTHKLAFIYEKTEQLDALLTAWSKNKDSHFKFVE